MDGPVNVFEYMNSWGHEQLVMCTDKEVGLKAVIAIHDTTLGPACGGLRIWPYGAGGRPGRPAAFTGHDL